MPLTTEDLAYAATIEEVHRILAGIGPTLIDIQDFDKYSELIEWLRKDYESGIPNAALDTWNSLKNLNFYRSIDIALQLGWAINPDRDLMGLGEIINYLTRDDNTENPKQLLINIVKDAAQLNRTELIQLIQIAQTNLGVPITWLNHWREAVREERLSGSGGGSAASAAVKQTSTSSSTPSGSSTNYVQNVITSFNLTDLGNARRLVDQHGNDIRYIHPWETWIIWDKTRWKRDESGEIWRRAKSTVMNIYQEAAQAADDDRRRDLSKWAHYSEGLERIRSMISLARSEPGIPIDHDDLDRDLYLLNVANGTIDLIKGTLSKHSRSHFMTKRANVIYDDMAICPIWLDFLSTIMDGSQEKVDFLKRAVGYSLTGDISAQVMFFCYGAGNNGKSTFLELIMMLLGDYSQKAPTDMVMSKKNTSGIPNDIARLPGARFVVASEVEAGQRLSENKVKDLTGKDKIPARFMRGEWFDFIPTHKLWMYGNYKPIIRGADAGIWRRIQLIPFTVTIPAEKRLTQMIEILWTEASGILNWAIEGCVEYVKNGLQTPEVITDAVRIYKEEMDIIGEFIADCLVVKNGEKLEISKLYAAYVAWCIEQGETPLDQRSLSHRFVERGFERTRASGGARCLSSLQLRNLP